MVMVMVTYFRGSPPIDGIWATSDVDVTGACIMPVGFGVGDHRLFVVDFRKESLLGASPPKIVRAPSRRLNTRIPGAAEKYVATLERLYVEHRMNTCLVEAARYKDDAIAKSQVGGVDTESKQYMKHSEKKCRKIKSGRIYMDPSMASIRVSSSLQRW